MPASASCLLQSSPAPSRNFKDQIDAICLDPDIEGQYGNGSKVADQPRLISHSRFFCAYQLFGQGRRITFSSTASGEPASRFTTSGARSAVFVNNDVRFPHAA